ncbi:MAG: hypothetical protein RLY86_1429 [Pseudomonadota bacterium]|jgi:hypothetical protein
MGAGAAEMGGADPNAAFQVGDAQIGKAQIGEARIGEARIGDARIADATDIRTGPDPADPGPDPAAPDGVPGGAPDLTPGPAPDRAHDWGEQAGEVARGWLPALGAILEGFWDGLVGNPADRAGDAYAVAYDIGAFVPTLIVDIWNFIVGFFTGFF